MNTLDIVGLRALATGTSCGSLIVIDRKENVEEKCKKLFGIGSFFFYHSILLSRNNIASPSPKMLLQSFVESTEEIGLNSYQIEGGTLEHIISTRLAEGFQIVEIFSENITAGGNSSFPSMAALRGGAQQINRDMTVRLEKFVTKMSILVYEITFHKEGKNSINKRFSVVNNTLFASNLSNSNSFITDNIKFEKTTEDLMWTRGILSIDLRKLSPRGSNVYQKSKITSPLYIETKDEKNSKTILWISQCIVDSDKQLAALLGGPYLSGFAKSKITSTPSTLRSIDQSHYTSTTNNNTNKKNSISSSVVVSTTTSLLPPPLAKNLAAYADLIEDISNLDDVYTTYIYLRPKVNNSHPHTKITPISSNEHVRVQILNDIIKRVINVTYHELSLLRWLFVLCSDDVPSSTSEYGIIIFEIVEVSINFLQIQVNKLSRGSGTLNETMYNISNCIFNSLRILKLNPYRCKCDLSLLSLTSINYNNFSSLSKNRMNIMTCLQGARAISNNSINNMNLLKIIAHELVLGKLPMGFHLSQYTVENSKDNNENGTITLYLHAVCSSCPTGINTESLIQCKIECSFDSICVEYYWCKSCNNTQYEHSTVSLSVVGEQSNENIESLVSILIEQDESIFQFYDIMRQFYLNKSQLGKFHLNYINWETIKNHSIKQVLSLPCFNSFELNKKLVNLLFQTLKQSINIIEIIVDGRKDDFFYSYKSGENHVIIEIKIKSLFVNDNIKYNLMKQQHNNENNMFNEEKHKFIPFSKKLIDQNEQFCHCFSIEIYSVILPVSNFVNSAATEWSDLSSEFTLSMNNCANIIYNNDNNQIINELTNLIWQNVFINITRSFYSAIVNDIYVSDSELNIALDMCDHHYCEVDISILYKKIKHYPRNNFTNSINSYSQEISNKLFSSIHNSFNSTIGKLILGHLNSKIFVFLSDKEISIPQQDNSDNSSSLKEDLINSIEDVSFIRFTVICKSNDISVPKIYPIPCNSANFSSVLLDICTSLISFTDSSELILKMDYMSSKENNNEEEENSNVSTNIINNKSKKSNSKSGSLESNLTINTDINSDAIKKSTPILSNNKFNILSKSMKEFIAMENLNILLNLNINITPEYLLLIQDCLTQVTCVKSFEKSLDFITPISNKNKRQNMKSSFSTTSSSQHENITSSFEIELRNQIPLISKIGDMMFSRIWILSSKDLATEKSKHKDNDYELLKDFKIVDDNNIIKGEVSDNNNNNTSQDIIIPCWILISFNQYSPSTPSAATSNSVSGNVSDVNNALLTTIKVVITLRKFDGTMLNIDIHDIIEKSLINKFDKCCFRINQRILLRDLHDTGSASPLLISPLKTSSLSSSLSIKSPIKSDQNMLLQQQQRLKSPSLNSSAQKKQEKIVGAGGKYLGLTKVIPPRISRSSMNVTPSNINESSIVDEGNQLFLSGHFNCPRQDEIVCIIHADATITQDAVIRHLETAELRDFAVSNLERYYVSQDKKGSIFYMTFDAPLNDKCVRLGLYGIDSIDKSMKDELQMHLEQRLTEITAKAISKMLVRNTSLTSSYFNFLKQSDVTKIVQVKFKLPSFVQDPYFFCTLARQVFLSSQVLAKLTVLTTINDKNILHPSEIIHPASLNYNLFDFQKNEEEDGDILASPRPQLLRKGHVYEVVKDETNVNKNKDSSFIHPMFFGYNDIINNINNTKVKAQESKFETSYVVWPQNDFTFLYNFIGQLPSNASAQYKNSAKQIGQGLALIEFSPVFNVNVDQITSGSFTHILKTGSEEALDIDVRELQQHVNSQKKINVEPIDINNIPSLSSSPNLYENKSDNIHEMDVITSINSNSVIVTNEKVIDLRVYPTVLMQTQQLVDFCAACFNEALTLYCIERVYSSFGNNDDLCNDIISIPLNKSNTSGNSLSAEKDDEIVMINAVRPNLLPSNTLLPFTNFKDFTKLSHDVLRQLKKSSLISSSCGVIHIPYTLPEHIASNLNINILSKLIETRPYLANSVLTYDTKQIFSPLPRCVDDTLIFEIYPYSEFSLPPQWIDFQVNKIRLSSSTLLGSNIINSLTRLNRRKSISLSNNSLNSSISQDIRFVIDSEGLDYLPNWLKKRNHSLEMSISTSGLYIFSFNISPLEIKLINNLCIEQVSLAMQLHTDIQNLYFNQLRYGSSNIKFIDGSNNDAENALIREEIILMQQQLNRLFWERKTIAKYYSQNNLNEDKKNIEQWKCLSKIPNRNWKKGIIIDSLYVPLPLAGNSYKRNKLYWNTEEENNSLDQYSMNNFLSFAETMINFCLVLNSDYVGNALSGVFYIVLPIPYTAMVHLTEFTLLNNSNLSIIHRIIDVIDLLLPPQVKNNNSTSNKNRSNLNYNNLVDLLKNSISLSSEKRGDSTLPLSYYILEQPFILKWRKRILFELISHMINQLQLEQYIPICVLPLAYNNSFHVNEKSIPFLSSESLLSSIDNTSVISATEITTSTDIIIDNKVSPNPSIDINKSNSNYNHHIISTKEFIGQRSLYLMKFLLPFLGETAYYHESYLNLTNDDKKFSYINKCYPNNILSKSYVPIDNVNLFKLLVNTLKSSNESETNNNHFRDEVIFLTNEDGNDMLCLLFEIIEIDMNHRLIGLSYVTIDNKSHENNSKKYKISTVFYNINDILTDSQLSFIYNKMKPATIHFNKDNKNNCNFLALEDDINSVCNIIISNVNEYIDKNMHKIFDLLILNTAWSFFDIIYHSRLKDLNNSIYLCQSCKEVNEIDKLSILKILSISKILDVSTHDDDNSYELDDIFQFYNKNNKNNILFNYLIDILYKAYGDRLYFFNNNLKSSENSSIHNYSIVITGSNVSSEYLILINFTNDFNIVDKYKNGIFLVEKNINENNSSSSSITQLRYEKISDLVELLIYVRSLF